MWRSVVGRKTSLLSKKLRLGILLDTFEVPAWVVGAIERITKGDAGEFVLAISNGAGPCRRDSPGNTWIYSAFNWADERLLRKEPDPFAPTSIKGLLANVPEIRVSPVQAGGFCSLKESDISAIRNCELDVLIRIGFECLQCEELHVARYGIWYYYHGDDTTTSGGPPGFWEVAENRAVTGTALISVGGDEFARRVLYRSYFFTYPLSPARHRSYYFWAAASFLPRQIEGLHRLGAAKFRQHTERFNNVPTSAPRNYLPPTGFLAAIPVARIMGRLVREFVKRLFYLDQWFLLLSLKKGISDGFAGFEVLMPSKDRFWADPHVTQRDGKYYIFLEEFLRTEHRGHISVIEVDELGRWKMPIKVLERPHHLSYPFVFQSDGRLYMVPESRANRTIDLYECMEFPHRWEFKKTLIANISAVDSTLLHHAGKWWLFTAVAENEAAAPNVELFLYYSDDLLDGQWNSHLQNPIVSDARSARPAGSLLLENGKLFRPSQNCAETYGHGFDLNEITVLSESDYCERRTMSIRPDWDRTILATHTYAHQGSLTVIDAFTYAKRMA